MDTKLYDRSESKEDRNERAYEVEVDGYIVGRVDKSAYQRWPSDPITYVWEVSDYRDSTATHGSEEVWVRVSSKAAGVRRLTK